MSNAGYSGTPLFKKLGIKEASRLLAINAPGEFWNWVAPLPDAVEIIENVATPSDVMVLFVTHFSELEKWFSKLESFMVRGNRLWIAYPKKSAKVATDLNFDVVQREGLALGIVDMKICAVSEVWSGVCFMRRKSL